MTMTLAMVPSDRRGGVRPQPLPPWGFKPHRTKVPGRGTWESGPAGMGGRSGAEKTLSAGLGSPKHVGSASRPRSS